MAQTALILPKGGYVWADRKKLHKQGKVIANYRLTVMSDKYFPMLDIKPVARLDIDRDLSNDYPDFLVDVNDCIAVGETIPIPAPAPSPAPADMDVITALRILIGFVKSI